MCKCGFQQCDSTKWFLAKVETDVYSDVWTSDEETVCASSGSFSQTWECSVVDGECDDCPLIDCSGSSNNHSSGIDGCGVIEDLTCTASFVDGECFYEGCLDGICDEGCGTCSNCCRCTYWAWSSNLGTTTGSTCSEDETVSQQTFNVNYTSGDDTATASETQTTTLSNEYTDELLVENAMEEAVYDDDFDDDCSAEFAPDEFNNCATISFFRFKVEFPALTEATTIYWTEHFEPATEDGTPFNTHKSALLSIAATEFIQEVSPPGEPGVVTLANVSLCLPEEP
jgi:hypothetical protein